MVFLLTILFLYRKRKQIVLDCFSNVTKEVIVLTYIKTNIEIKTSAGYMNEGSLWDFFLFFMSKASPACHSDVGFYRKEISVCRIRI